MQTEPIMATRTKKKSNNTLWLLLLLIVVVGALVFLLPDGGEKSVAGTTTEALADAEAAEEMPDAQTRVNVADQAPDFTVEMFDGSRTTLSSLRGKVVLLNFWATWCPPCRQELTRVQSDLIARFAGRDFVFLPVSRGEERADVEAFRQKTGYTFAMGLDPDQKVYDLYAGNYIPRNFLIDRDGKVLLASVGYEPEEFDALLDAIEKALGQ